MNINIDTVAFDADTADVDALRAQVKAVTSMAFDLSAGVAELESDLSVADEQVKAVTSNARHAEVRIAELESDLSVAVNLIKDLADGNEDDIREMCNNDERLALFVGDFDIVDLSRDYEIRVTVPVTMTIIVSGNNEDDAIEGIGEHLSSEVRVDVHGAEDYDFDSYDFHIDDISEA